jgi:hypothetical protein
MAAQVEATNQRQQHAEVKAIEQSIVAEVSRESANDRFNAVRRAQRAREYFRWMRIAASIQRKPHDDAGDTGE